MERDQIHRQLLADCHYLGSLPACELLLHRNAALPWFILVPDTQITDLLDLPEPHLEVVMADCAAVSAFIKQFLGFDKVNFAGLGNVVPQMHLHIIGRREGNLSLEGHIKDTDDPLLKDRVKNRVQVLFNVLNEQGLAGREAVF